MKQLFEWHVLCDCRITNGLNGIFILPHRSRGKTYHGLIKILNQSIKICTQIAVSLVLSGCCSLMFSALVWVMWADDLADLRSAVIWAEKLLISPFTVIFLGWGWVFRHVMLIMARKHISCLCILYTEPHFHLNETFSDFSDATVDKQIYWKQ